MSAPRKRWNEHSLRWRREAEKQGLSKQRWDAWFKLSPKSKAVAEPRKYAAGVSVADQRRAKAEDDAYKNMRQQLGATARESTIRLGIQEMTAEQLKWTAKASRVQIAKRASVKLGSGVRNPWWYR